MRDCAHVVRMAMKLLHALAAVLTVLLLIVRQRCISARSMSPIKQRSLISALSSCGGSSLKNIAQLTKNCAACKRSASINANITCLQPKYKRDPDIQIDNEDIGVQPRDD